MRSGKYILQIESLCEVVYQRAGSNVELKKTRATPEQL